MPEGGHLVPAGIDYGHGGEPAAPVVRRIVSPKDDALLAARAAGLVVLEGRYRVEKYQGQVAPANLYEVIECPPNLFLTAGVTTILNLIVGASSTHFDATNARLCVGDSTTAATAGQGDLQATTNKLRKVVDGAPTVSGNAATFVATFGTGDANYDWREVGVANAASGAGSLWTRQVVNLGTKVGSAAWVLNWSVSIS
jgi:hypothetical protein